MIAAHQNIVLIGMPGAGKTTIGPLLAQALGRVFTDTDTIIEQAQGMSLQRIVDTQGYQALRAIEAKQLSALDVDEQVIATGGSAVYSPQAMAALQRKGVIVHLHVDLDVIRARMDNFATRGIARAVGQTLDELYTEREALYRRYAEVSVVVSALTPEAACEAIIQALSTESALALSSGIIPPY